MVSTTQETSSPAPFRRRIHPLFRDLALTGGAEVAVLLTGFVVISILGRLLGAVALGEYLLLRRVLSWLQTGTQLGLGVALPRSVAHAVTGSDRDRKSYLCVTLLLILTVAVIVAAVLVSGRAFFAGLFFGKPGATHLVLALALLLTGLGAHVSVYGYYRGLLAMGCANALQLWNLALVPVLSVLTLRHTGSIALIVSVIGAITLVSSLAAALPVAAGVWRSIPGAMRAVATQLLRYGIPRVPGDFGSSALFALGPVLAAHYVPMRQVASLLLGLSILAAVSVSAAPLGVVLLSKITIMLAQGRTEEVRAGLKQFLALTLELPVFIAVQLFVFADVLVRAWVGPGFTAALPVIRIILIAIPFYLLFVALRSVIDAASITAYNTRNVFVALVAFLVFLGVVAAVVPSPLFISGIAVALVCALLVLAWLTSRTVQKLYQVKLNWSESAIPLIMALLLGATSYLLRWTHSFQIGTLQTCAIELVMSGLFLGVLRRLNSPWLISIWQLANGSLNRELTEA